MKRSIEETKLLLGIEANVTTDVEKLVSGAGAFVGILAVYIFSLMVYGNEESGQFSSALVVGSMGATAVLLFAVPHGVLSQPWAVFGGHMVSAFIGVSCQRFFPVSTFLPAIAVALAIVAMYYLRCLHPPGGATALTAVIGGTPVTSQGFEFLAHPVFFNVAVMLGVAFCFNYLFSWRRYPAHLVRRKRTTSIQPLDRIHELTHEDFSAAIQSMDSFLDITAEDIAELLELAKIHAEKHAEHPSEIIEGKFYSNGKLGSLWSVRQVIDAANHPDPQKDMVIYKVMAGHGAYEIDKCSREEFRLWTRFEVEPSNGHWRKCF